MILGSTHPRQAIGEQQLTDLVTGMRDRGEDLAAMTPDQARQAVLDRLGRIAHLGLVAASTPDGRAVPGKSRVSGESLCSQELQSWTVNGRSGRSMSARVRTHLDADDPPRWLANVATVLNDIPGVVVRPDPHRWRS